MNINKDLIASLGGVPELKLGKLAPLHDPRTLMLADYLDRASLPRVPASHSWAAGIPSWPMMLNDRIGDCACAGPAHLIQLWTSHAGKTPFVPTDQQVLDAYSAISGYDPNTGANDNGCNLLTVMKYWKNVGIGGHRIDGFAAVDPHNPKLIATAIFLFGGVIYGIALPKSAQKQISGGQPWTVTGGAGSQPNSWGGHCIVATDYSPSGCVDITWGRTQAMDWGFATRYGDEIYVPISKDWLVGGKVSPSGFAYDALLQDMHLI